MMCITRKLGSHALSLLGTLGLASQLLGQARPVDTLSLRPPNAGLAAQDGFTFVLSVRELADGRVLVADYGVGELLLVDFRDSTVNQVGRHGEGPGEYSRPGWLYPLAGDSTLLTDYYTRRWFVMVHAEIVKTFPSWEPLINRLGANLAGADPSGDVLGVAGYGYGHGHIADSGRAYLVHDALTEEPRVDSMGQLGGLGRLGVVRVGRPGVIGILPNPLASEDQVRLFPDGWIAFAYSDPYRVEWRRPDGTMVEGADLASSRVPVTKERLCAVQRRRVPGSFLSCEDIVVPDVPRYLPAFLQYALLPTPAGRLLIQRTPVALKSDVYYDVVDRAGRLRAVIRTAENQRIVGFGPRSVYLITIDDMTLQHLTRHPCPAALCGS